MKKLLVTFLILNLYSFSVNASEIIQTPKTEIENNVDWGNIIDYVNAKVTYYYISEQINKGSIKSDEEIESFKTFESELDNSNLNNIISFSDLKSFLKPHFGKTLENISSPIDSLKVNNLDTEPLFVAVLSILSERQSNVQNTDQFQQLKDSVTSFVKEKDTYVVAETKDPVDESNESFILSNTTLLILASLFLFSTIFFIIVWLYFRDENRKLKNAILVKNDEIINLKWENKKPTVKTPPTENRRVNKSHENSKPEIRKNQNYQNNQNNPKGIPIEDNKSPEIVLPVEAKELVNIIEHLYAGKPTENRVLKEISTQSDPQQTIFKLKILPNNNELAEFEVFHVSDFMTRSITNAPDDYLYRVCNHENTNQEFRKEILTVKKGKANLINGEWVVKEENKATIKFQ